MCEKNEQCRKKALASTCKASGMARPAPLLSLSLLPDFFAANAAALNTLAFGTALASFAPLAAAWRCAAVQRCTVHRAPCTPRWLQCTRTTLQSGRPADGLSRAGPTWCAVHCAASAFDQFTCLRARQTALAVRVEKIKCSLRHETVQ